MVVGRKDVMIRFRTVKHEEWCWKDVMKRGRIVRYKKWWLEGRT